MFIFDIFDFVDGFLVTFFSDRQAVFRIVRSFSGSTGRFPGRQFVFRVVSSFSGSSVRFSDHHPANGLSDYLFG